MVVRPRSAVFVALVVTSALLRLAGAAETPANSEQPHECQRYGTALDWMSDFDAAVRRAAEQDKPLLVIHISGNFAKNAFT